jgi:uncharacterized protein (AIM24 family)
MVRCESGALNYMIGDIAIYSQLVPSVGGAVSSLLAGESVYRPTYSGTGTITLESSLGGFHIVELNGESWILEKGAYWASEGSVKLQFFKERLLTSLWAGEGKVAVTTKGPVEELFLEDGKEVVVDGDCVIGRTASVSFKMKRPTRNFMGRFTAGEPFVKVYTGPGKILLNPTFYWRYYMSMQKQKQK